MNETDAGEVILSREAATSRAIPIRCLDADGYAAWQAQAPDLAGAYAKATGFEPRPGRHCLLPSASGDLSGVIVGVDGGPEADRLEVGRLATALPPGIYALEEPVREPALVTLSWALGAYAYARYRKAPRAPARLVAPAGVEAAEIRRVAAAVATGRDLVNAPANDLGPEEVEVAIRTLAERHGARVESTVGPALAREFPLVHAVGQASARAPRLVDLTWGDAAAPKVTLVGKGVVFDTGGLDIKPASAMLLMKKDMAGAAAAIAAADMVMGAGLPVRLRLLVPTVENSIAGNAFRPGDVFRSRAGLTVEIGNTDAEGRLILADALSLADGETPDLLVDFATLTGAARTALGPDLPALFTPDDALAADIARCGEAVGDPLWRLPLWAPYGKLLSSKVADVNHVSSGPFAGAVTAALFLRRFAPRTRAHVHLDLYGWNPTTKPGRPEGGEVQAARAVYALLRERYSPG